MSLLRWRRINQTRCCPVDNELDETRWRTSLEVPARVCPIWRNQVLERSNLWTQSKHLWNRDAMAPLRSLLHSDFSSLLVNTRVHQRSFVHNLQNLQQTRCVYRAAHQVFLSHFRP